MNPVKKILLVDDEVSFTRIVKLNLETNGPYEVRIENQGKNAFATARAFRPDLILLDVIMPDIDGGQIAAEMQEDPALKAVPIVFLTAVVSKHEVKSHGEHIGGRAFLAKPVSVQELLNTVKKNLAA